MFSSLFIKLSLISLGTLGIGVGGYFVYKNTFSKKVEETNTTTPDQLNRGKTINSNGEGNTTEGRRNSVDRNEQQTGGESPSS